MVKLLQPVSNCYKFIYFLFFFTINQFFHDFSAAFCFILCSFKITLMSKYNIKSGFVIRLNNLSALADLFLFISKQDLRVYSHVNVSMLVTLG